MADEPLTVSEGRELRNAIRELTQELKDNRLEAAKTYVRQDTHTRDMQLLTQSHNKDIQLLTQTLTALKESTDKSIDNLGGDNGRVTKLEDDGDWLKKIVYGAIVIALLAMLGIGGAISTGVLPK